MLIRKTEEGGYECVTQAQHAVQSGVLAAAWCVTPLPPLLVLTIGLHDAPWGEADARPVLNGETGLPHDFLDYPKGAKFALYGDGIDALEAVHPWVAYMVSKHYTTFAGTKGADELTAPEAARRARLESLLPPELVDGADEALAWIKFFDTFSLHLCLTGPGADADAIPVWLRDPGSWSSAPDGTSLRVSWRDDVTVEVDPWPFARAPDVSLYLRRLGARVETQDELNVVWGEAAPKRRDLRLVAAGVSGL